MYSTSEAKIFNASEGSNLTAGIHENVTLQSAKLDKSPNKGNAFLEIVFVKDGRTISTTEWEPTRFPGMTDEDMKKKAHRQMGRMLQILECFYPENDPRLQFTGASFTDFANWVVNLLNNADKTTLLRIKAVYNDKGFIGLPTYARYKFIEPMALAEGQTYKVEIIENTDKLVRPVQADQEKTVTNPFTNSPASSTQDSQDLPF